MDCQGKFEHFLHVLLYWHLYLSMVRRFLNKFVFSWSDMAEVLLGFFKGGAVSFLWFLFFINFQNEPLTGVGK